MFKNGKTGLIASWLTLAIQQATQAAMMSPQERAFRALPIGDKVLCNQPGGYVRTVDRRIWNKLDGAARARWLDAIKAETEAMASARIRAS